MKRAVIYCRISNDKEGAGLGVKRQEEDCRELAERRGLDVIEVHVDNDMSAYSGRPRKGYIRMMEGAKAGAFDVIIAWHNDRLHRHPKELEDFITILETCGILVETVKAGRLKLDTPADRLMARNLGSFARYESEHKSERIKRKHLERAEKGLPCGGGHRAYGFMRDGLTPNEAEAEIIRDCARRRLDGEKLRAIVRDMNEQGVATVTGRQWTASSLKRLLCSPRIAGLRQHNAGIPKGATYRGDALYPAAWPAIIERPVWERLRAVLDDPARRHQNYLGRYLLTGLMVCDRCGHRMSGRPDERGKRRYVCNKSSGPGCGRMFILAEPTEVFLRDAARSALNNPAFVARLRAGDCQDGDEEILAQIEEDTATLKELSRDYYVNKLITRDEYQEARSGLEHRIEASRAELSKRARTSAGTTIIDAFIGLENFDAEWNSDKTTDDRRAAVLAACMIKVEVKTHPNPGSNKINDAVMQQRLRIDWRK